jgi:hypothetical protein
VFKTAVDFVAHDPGPDPISFAAISFITASPKHAPVGLLGVLITIALVFDFTSVLSLFVSGI